MEGDTKKAQCRPKAAGSDGISSAGSGNVVSLQPSGTKSEERKAPPETDDSGVAVAASNKADTDSGNRRVTKRERPSVVIGGSKTKKPRDLNAVMMEREGRLKRQVEMTNKRMAKIMKEVDGWEEWDTIDIVIPENTSGIFRVNDSIDVKIKDVVDCVQLLLSRIHIRRFSMNLDAISDEDVGVFGNSKTLPMIKAVVKALMDALVKSKDDGVAITELRIEVADFLLESSKFGEVITVFCDTLTRISAFQLDPITMGAIGKCDHLEALAFDFAWFEWNENNHPLKDALAGKSSLTSLSVGQPAYPFDILVAGVHHLKYLRIESLSRFEMGDEPTADQANLLSNLETLDAGFFRYMDDMDSLLDVLRVAPDLKRVHIIGCTSSCFMTDFMATPPGDVSVVLRDLAKECRRSRSLVISVEFELEKITANGDGDVAANDDDQGMLATMMEYDKAFVTSRKLRRYGVMAFDERLHAFDATLIPPTTERPPQITSINGSRIYKRLFKIDVGSGHHLSVAFDESPEMEVHHHEDFEHDEDEEGEHDEEDDNHHPEVCPLQ